ncbi:MAG: hypothetical protein ACR2NU_02160 [Aeoliella sp.]
MSFTKLIVVAFILTACFVAIVHAASPRLGQVAPQGGQRGTELKVTLSGQRLGQNPQEILWHEPGIEVRGLEKIDDNQVAATLFLPDDCPLGIHGIRLRTASGISNLVTFHVGTLPEIQEAEPNSSSDAPQPVELGVVVNGVVENEDVDYYAFEAKQGAPISVEVEALRLGRTFFDPVIALYNPDGEELALRDDLPLMRQDSCVGIIAPADGRYVLELRESAYRGNGNCSYRLHIGSFPRPVAVYPPGGRVGEKVTVNWIGDAAGTATEEVTLPGEPTDRFSYFPSCERGTSPSPHPLRVVELPVTREAEPNNAAAEATTGEAPGAFCGIIEQPGDQDHFRFAAKNGQVLHFRLRARSIGSPLDSVMRLFDAEGKRLAGNDDDSGLPDSYLRFQAPADGEFIVQVDDHLRRGGDSFIYWLEVRPDEPVVNLDFEEQRRYEAQLFEVPQAGRSAAMLRATRVATGGELEVDWKDLPAGVSVEAFPLAGNYNRIPVLLTAAKDATLGQGLATLTARRTEGESNDPLAANFTQRNWLVRGQNNRDVWNYMGSRAVVVVTEAAPYSIRLEESKAPLVQRGTKNVKVVATRKEGFNEAILVRMLYNPPGVSSNASLRVKQGETEVTIPITANQNASVGEWPILVRGEANVAGQLVTCTPFTTLRVATPYLAMGLPKAKVEQGNSVSFPITIQQQTPFEGEATVELVGLPPGVTTAQATITKETTEIAFQLEVAADARPGKHRGIFCRVTLQEQGEPVVHSVGAGELRVDRPLPPSSTTQASR